MEPSETGGKPYFALSALIKLRACFLKHVRLALHGSGVGEGEEVGSGVSEEFGAGVALTFGVSGDSVSGVAASMTTEIPTKITRPITIFFAISS